MMLTVDRLLVLIGQGISQLVYSPEFPSLYRPYVPLYQKISPFDPSAVVADSNHKLDCIKHLASVRKMTKTNWNIAGYLVYNTAVAAAMHSSGTDC